MLATTLRSGAATTAASSPGPSRTAGVVVSREVSSLMSPNSPSSPTVPFIAVAPSRARLPLPGREPSPCRRYGRETVNFCCPYAGARAPPARGSPRGARRRDTVAFLLPT